MRVNGRFEPLRESPEWPFHRTTSATSFKGFLDQMSAAAPTEEPIFRRRLRDHFECEPNELPTLSEKFPAHDHANLHSALEAEFAGADCWSQPSE